MGIDDAVDSYGADTDPSKIHGPDNPYQPTAEDLANTQKLDEALGNFWRPGEGSNNSARIDESFETEKPL